MGRKSVRENKSLYQLSRERTGLSRAAAAERIGTITDDRLEKMEIERTEPKPEDVLAMAEAYDDPMLCNRYCIQKCTLGVKTVMRRHNRELSGITLELLYAINRLKDEQERLKEIAAMGEPDARAREDLAEIRTQLDRFSTAFDSLKVWMRSNMD